MATNQSDKTARIIRTGNVEVAEPHGLEWNSQPRAEPRSPKAVSDIISPVIEKMRTTSTAEIDKLIRKLQAERKHLEAQGERLLSETARYVELTQNASVSVKVIVESLSEWRKVEMQSPAQAGRF